MRTFDQLYGQSAANSGQGSGRRSHQSAALETVLMIDLAVPEDIEPQVAELSDIYLHRR